jgi:cupin fold WbuC family metalloprotein
LLVVEGRARAVFFDDGGTVESVLELGEPPHGTFAYHVGAGRYHSLLIESDWLIFLEVGQGPFSTTSSLFPDWAPDGNDPAAARDFESQVASEAARILGR